MNSRVRRVRKRWLFLFLVCLLPLLFWQKRSLKRWLARGERKLFAHLGDQGPLQQVNSQPWRRIRAGLWSKTLFMKRKKSWWRFKIRVLKIDPKRFRLRLWAGPPASVREVMKKTGAVAAINAGLFDTKRRPLGLFLRDGKTLNRRLNRRSIDGVFFVRAGSPGIARGSHFRRKNATLAFQSAPLLVVAGKRLRLPKKRWSWQIDRRSAVCLNQRGQLLWAVTDTFLNGLSFTELGLLMKQPEKERGLGCVEGLNLDGGASSQMAYRRGDRLRQIAGLEKVPVFLWLAPRKQESRRRETE